MGAKIEPTIITNQMRKLTLLFALLTLFAGYAAAQVTQVSGQVFDKADGLPVIGATVSVEGTKIVGITDVDGRFSLKGLTPAHQTISVSFIGYEKVSTPAKSEMKIYLETKAQMMDEVIVVAFGKQKREAFTGSAAVVTAAEITQQQVTNPIEALNGKVAGLQMTDNNSLATGTEPTIRIRGFSSLNANNQPLIVVDGLPYSGYLNDLNPADIESMTVLKDAASNALYGARGANGVIMITTKGAQRGETRVNFDAKWGVNTNGRVEYDLIDNPGEYYEAYYMALRNNYMYRQENPMPFDQAHITANKTLGLPYTQQGLGYMVYDVPQGEYLIGTNGRLNPHAVLGNRVLNGNDIYTLYPDNWLKQGTRNGFRQEYNINVTGGNEKYSLMAALGYLNNEGLTPSSEITRINARLKANYQAFSFLRLGGSAGYTNTNSDNLGDVFGTPYTMAPIYPLYVRDANGKIMQDKNGNRYDYGNKDMGVTRPVDTNGNVNQSDILDINSCSSNAFNIQGYATFDFLNDFHFTVNGSVYITEARTKRTYNPDYGYSVTDGGSTSIAHGRTTDTNYQQLLNWNRQFGAHNVDVLLGHEYSRQQYANLSGSGSMFADYNNSELSGVIIYGSPTSSRSLYNVEGWFGRAQYDYDSRYFFSGSFRRDGSSRFHPDHRWGNFWSLGGAWILTKEEWFPKSKNVNMLKYKISYGEQGNDGIGDFLYTDLYWITNNNNDVALSFGSKGKSDITWETVGNFNTGFEFELFNSRLRGEVDYYYRQTRDMLMWLSAPTEIGYDGYYDNIGDMSNTGIEVNLSGDVIATKDFRWTIGMNMTWQKNRIDYIPSEKAGLTMEGHRGYTSGAYFYGEGLPMYTFYTKRFAGVNENGESMFYRNGSDGQLETTTTYSDGDYYLCGNAMPTIFGGFDTSLSGYGFDLSLQFNYSVGGKKWDTGYQALMSAPTDITIGGGIHRDVFKSWTPENPNSSIPMFYYSDVYGAAASDRFLTDASYLALRNATLGYTFPESITKRLKMTKLRIYATCENVAYWTKRKGFDPRQSLTDGSYGGWPPMRTISGGIQVQF